jgi:streptogramin lyase
LARFATGILWISGNGNGTIVRFDPKTAAMKVYKMPDPAVDDEAVPQCLVTARWCSAYAGASPALARQAVITKLCARRGAGISGACTGS